MTQETNTIYMDWYTVEGAIARTQHDMYENAPTVSTISTESMQSQMALYTLYLIMQGKSYTSYTMWDQKFGLWR